MARCAAPFARPMSWTFDHLHWFYGHFCGVQNGIFRNLKCTFRVSRLCKGSEQLQLSGAWVVGEEVMFIAVFKAWRRAAGRRTRPEGSPSKRTLSMVNSSPWVPDSRSVPCTASQPQCRTNRKMLSPVNICDFPQTSALPICFVF